MLLNSNGRDWGTLVNWDALGKVYASIIIAWSVTLAAGMLWLIANRQLNLIRMRNLPLILSSTGFLHVYLVKIFLAYTTNGNFSCSAEFWIMSIYLPFGIALFQANVMQLRSMSHLQMRMLEKQISQEALLGPSPSRSFTSCWKGLTEAQKGYICIVFGMLVQLIVTSVLYATTPVLQGEWSSFGQVPHSKGQALCRKSYQWIPSAVWQLLWSWIYGPYILFQIRNVRDTHHWRLQTFLTVVSGLPGAPLWLAAVFTNTDAFKPINKWFVPPMWLAPGIIVMQFVTVFFPIFEFFSERQAITELGATIKPVVLSDSRPGTASTEQTLAEESQLKATRQLFEDLAITGSADLRCMYRVSALERALVINHKPLLNFAATRDFTAENIIFLVKVQNWKSAWDRAPRDPKGGLTLFAKVELLKTATEIYCESISQRTADFPINIADSVARPLRQLLGPYQAQLSQAAASDCANPSNGDIGLVKGPNQTIEWMSPEPTDDPDFDVERFADFRRNPWAIRSPDVKTVTFDVSEDTDEEPPARHGPVVIRARAVEAWKEAMSTEGVPRAFNGQIFDAAQASIMVLVLTNTWRKFVTEQEKKHAFADF